MKLLIVNLFFHQSLMQGKPRLDTLARETIFDEKSRDKLDLVTIPTKMKFLSIYSINDCAWLES